MPNLTEFLSLGTPNITSGQTHVPSILDVSLPRNQWYFQYEFKLGTGERRINLCLLSEVSSLSADP